MHVATYSQSTLWSMAMELWSNEHQQRFVLYEQQIKSLASWVESVYLHG